MITRKIMLLGEMSVGKTSIANRLKFDRFSESYKSTLGVEIYHYDVEPSPGNEPFKFLIWDTDGNVGDALFKERQMRGAQAAIVVGDLSRRETLETQFKLAIKFADAFPGRYLAAVINKVDLADEISADDDYVPAGLRDAFFPCHRTSAKTGKNIRETFHTAAQTIVRRNL